jgi:hypothetical protein
MIQKVVKYYTIVEIIQAMGIQAKPYLTWKVGKLMSESYERRVGRRPDNELNNKTNDGGSHHFCYYPEDCIKEVHGYVGMCKMEAARQPNLFSFEEPF